MEVVQQNIKVSDLFENYTNNAEEGVFGYNNRLDIRPPYQREFVYSKPQEVEVIKTILQGFPLNVIYWAKKVDEDDAYEVLDGQQRTISVCDYLAGNFAVDEMYFENQPEDIKQKILNYVLDVYICDGEDSEKLGWFKTVNIAGEKLNDQELLNAVYAGSWTTDARHYFSKPQGAAYDLGKKYLNGNPIRQDYLQTALKWIADRDETTVTGYMSRHQHDPKAVELWNYFNDVIEWVHAMFPTYRAPMKGVGWGYLYNAYGDRADLDPEKLEAQIAELMEDDEITNLSGIYEFVLNNNYKCLNLRKFDKDQKTKTYESQKGICRQCGKHFEFDQMDADHIIPWSQGGKTILENCQVLCRSCNRANST